eukprot:m51a1_g3574 hypothetical protein (364) ;mRNA; r:1105919-1107190
MEAESALARALELLDGLERSAGADSARVREIRALLLEHRSSGELQRATVVPRHARPAAEIVVDVAAQLGISRRGQRNLLFHSGLWFARRHSACGEERPRPDAHTVGPASLPADPHYFGEFYNTEAGSDCVLSLPVLHALMVDQRLPVLVVGESPNHTFSRALAVARGTPEDPDWSGVVMSCYDEEHEYAGRPVHRVDARDPRAIEGALGAQREHCAVWFQSPWPAEGSEVSVADLVHGFLAAASAVPCVSYILLGVSLDTAFTWQYELWRLPLFCHRMCNAPGGVRCTPAREEEHTLEGGVPGFNFIGADRDFVAELVRNGYRHTLSSGSARLGIEATLCTLVFQRCSAALRNPPGTRNTELE